GHIDIANGVFVDQLWVNFAQVYFNKTKTLKAFGYNVAPWNLHERHDMQEIGSKYIMGNNTPLVFYHFSSNLSGERYRYSAHNTPIVKRLNELYHSRLEQNNIVTFKSIPCYYIVERGKSINQAYKNRPLKNK